MINKLSIFCMYFLSSMSGTKFEKHDTKYTFASMDEREACFVTVDKDAVGVTIKY